MFLGYVIFIIFYYYKYTGIQNVEICAHPLSSEAVILSRTDLFDTIEVSRVTDKRTSS